MRGWVVLCLLCFLGMAVEGVWARPKKTQKSQKAQKSPKAQTTQQARVPAETATSRNDGDYVTEKRSDGTIVKYKKKTSYDFEGTDIEGLFNRPSGAYISDVKGVKGRSIIRVRKNFDAEVIDSSRWVK